MNDAKPQNAQPGLVCTFYSYKGGVGRSMALASVAAVIASEGYRVLVVDWDLEAPGLEVYFQNASKVVGEPAKTPGVVDLLTAHAKGDPISWRECLLHAKFFDQSLDIISAGRKSDDYRRQLRQLDWDTLFREHRIGNYVNDLREEWRSKYDFVLIDSRTGITDIGDICTVLLPDVLVLLFVTNRQSVDGVKDAMDRALRARSKLPVNRSKLLAVPVPARDERDREYANSLEWHRIFSSEFGALYRDWLPREVDPKDALNRIFIPYVASWSFGERIPVLESERERADPTSIGAAYTRLASLLSHRLDWYAVEGRASAADLVSTRVELKAARSAAAHAESRLRKQWIVSVSIGATALVLALAGMYWSWTHSAPRRLARARAYQLTDANPDTRESAYFALQKLGESNPQVAAEFAALLQDRDPRVREGAAEGLGIMGKAGARFAPQIINLLKDEEISVRGRAVRALGDIGRTDPEVAAKIVTFLKDKDPRVRADATTALGEMKEIGGKFAPEIAALLKDVDADVRLNAALALGSLGNSGSEFAPQVATLLEDKNSSVRGRAARALAKMGEAGAKFAPQVAALLEDKDWEPRGSAAGALAKMGEAGANFAPQVATLLEDKNSFVRWEAVGALAKMGEAGAKFAPQIRALLKDQDSTVRQKAADALKALEK